MAAHSPIEPPRPEMPAGWWWSELRNSSTNWGTCRGWLLLTAKNDELARITADRGLTWTMHESDTFRTVCGLTMEEAVDAALEYALSERTEAVLLVRPAVM